MKELALRCSAMKRAVLLQREVFALEYIKDFNGREAAIRAGYATRSPEVTASRLLRDDKVKTLILQYLKERRDKLFLDSGEVLRELARLAFSDPTHLFDENNRVLPIKEMPEATRRALASVKVHELYEGRGEDRELIGYSREVKLWDKTRALELLMKHLGLLSEQEQGATTNVDTVNILVVKS